MNKKFVISVFMVLLTIVLISIISPMTLSQSIGDRFYWNGQDAVFQDNIDPNKKYALYTHDDGDLESFQSELLSNSSGYLNIDTDKYPSGKFKVVSENRDYNFTYDVVDQELEIDSNKTKAIDGSRIDTEIISNRARFNLTVNSENTDNDELVDSIELPSSRIEVIDENVTLYNVTNEENITINTSYLPSDSIEYQYNVTDTNTSYNLTIMTTDEPRTQVEFNQSRYVNFAGNKFDMQFEMGPDVNEFDLQIGNDVYVHNVTIKETNNNGLANVTFDSFEAGNGSKPVEAGQDTKIVDQDPDPSISNQILAPKSYEMNVSVNGVITDQSSLRLREIVEGDISISSITGEKINVRRDDLNNSTKTNNISKEDYAVIKIEIGGLQRIINGSVDPSDLKESSSFSDKYDLYVEIIEESRESANSEKQVLNLSKTHRIITNRSTNEIYLIVQGSKFPNTEFDNNNKKEIDKINEYKAKFVIEEESDLIISDDDDVDDDIVTSSDKNINIYESTVIPRQRYSNEEESYILHRSDGDFQFETTLVPERNISFVMDGDISDSFDQNITEDLRFNYSYDNISNYSIGEEFTLTVIPTSEEYEYTIGDNNLIKNITVPDQIRKGEKIEINTTINEEYADNITVSWNINGVDKEGTNITHTFDETGELEIQATAHNDGNILYDEEEESVTINNSVYQGSLGIESNDVIFTGSNTTFNSTTDYIGSLEYEWKIGNQTVGSNDSIQYSFENMGNINISVTATSENNNSTENIQTYVYDGYGESERLYDYFSSSASRE